MTATKGARTRQQLIEAAAEIAVHGREAKIINVAARLGLTQPAVYRHFRTRDEVHEAVVREFREKLRDLIANSLIPPSTEVEDLQMLTMLAVASLMQFLEANRDAMTVAMLQKPEGEQYRQELIAMIAVNVQAEIEAGHFRAHVTPEFFATCLVGIVTQFIRHPIPQRDLMPTAEMIALLMLKGIQRQEN
ncbi:TetR/AcrR family transcriptional regulator [Brucella intermedia]|uniref:TetR/AcrR family transcriptional regulator n=1 Tax=Brucella intermedia TaxID=94625 RepID=UPI00124EE597|nr:TetR/AcrR family transcriptional regulator [Brucella intermedia]KAB2729225.1 TetR/AcrR family transcriptional regulator [Brucella intermedia]